MEVQHYRFGDSFIIYYEVDDDVMDADHIDEIYEYFRESETDDIETALEELGDDSTETDIRLVRIKFMSEMGN